MNYVLDTDTIIYLLKGSQSISTRLAAVNPQQIHTTIINHSELHFGAYNSKKQRSNLNILADIFTDLSVLDYCTQSSEIFAQTKAHLKKKGSLIADMDLMIASICIANNMTLITNNLKHCRRIKKLSMDNWLRE